MVRADNFRFPINEERRVTERLLLYWNSLRRQRQFPERGEISPPGIEFWDDCMLIKAESAAGGPLWQVEHGSAGLRMLASYLADDAGSLDSYMASHYREVVKSARPVQVSSAFPSKEGGEVKCRMILLPIGPDGDRVRVSHILGCASVRLCRPGEA